MNDTPYFFTWSSQRSAQPFEILGGTGAHFDVRTAGGIERWLDLGSLSYQATLGHGVTRIARAIQRQCDELLLTVPNGSYPAKEALARALLRRAPPGFTKVFFTLGGAEATENALKIARLATGRHKLLSRYRSYHGATMGALSLSGDHRRAPLEPGLHGVVHALPCFESRLPGGGHIVEGGGSAAALAETLALEENVGAVFLEPVPGANGALVPPAGYWPEVRRACDRTGALLVADCVLDGFGRLGSWYGFEGFLDGAAPDLVTLSKGITGGYAPLGAVLVHERVASHFDERVLWAGLTFYAHPLGVAAGLEAMRVYEEDRLVERAAGLAVRFAARLGAMQDRHPDRIPRVRASGLLGGLELSGDFASVARRLEERRIYAHPNARISTLVLAPPLVIEEADLDRGLDLVEEAIAGS